MTQTSDVFGLTDADLLRAVALGDAAYREAVRRGLIEKMAPVAGGQFKKEGRNG